MLLVVFLKRLHGRIRALLLLEETVASGVDDLGQRLDLIVAELETRAHALEIPLARLPPPVGRAGRGLGGRRRLPHGEKPVAQTTDQRPADEDEKQLQSNGELKSLH